MAKRTLIIGGVAGGATTAARLRRRDSEMEIIVFERGDYISYANCGLPYYIGDVIKSRDSLLLQTPLIMKNRFNIDVRVSQEVIKIIPEDKKIIIKNRKTEEEYDMTYDNLVIATGSSPLIPNIEGIKGDNIFTLWTVPDTDNIKEYIKNNAPKKATVIGGGFIGLEMAENLSELGLEVNLIEMQNQVMPVADYEMANLLHENMRMNGVSLILGDGVKAFRKSGNGTIITLNSGEEIQTDMVILSIGVKPNSELAKDAGIQINNRGGIVVNEFLETSEKDIYALGDVIEVDNYILKDKTMIPLAGPANKQGRILADNLSGDRKKYRGSLGTSVAKVFDLSIALTGVNEKTLKNKGMIKNKDYFTAIISQKSHAGYYPGATPLILKLIFDREGKIFGAQIVGQEGADKRIDTIATTIGLNGTIYDLSELELAYAPPFSSAKDPVNMLGFVAENILNNMAAFIEYNELDDILSDDDKKSETIVLDVTEEVERMVYEISPSVNIPLGELRGRMEELDRNKLIIVYCAIGVRSYNAARILMDNGFNNVKILSGGTSFYRAMHHNDGRKVEIVEKVEEKVINTENIISDVDLTVLDCCGLQCPGPIMKVNEALLAMNEGEVIKVSATDMGFASDVDAWCRRTGNTLVKKERNSKENIVYIRKGAPSCENRAVTKNIVDSQGKTLIVFSGDLDKVLASFIIANGAAAMGRPVTMFFTFWGLNALRKTENIKVKKPFMDKMFGIMMPKGAKKLKLSKMNMGGMGTAMMKKVMKDKNVNSLPELLQSAMDNGVKIVACTMSMDVMGLTKEELIDGIEYAGVASYLGDAEESNVNLFI